MPHLSFLLRFLRSRVEKAPMVKSTLITARSGCVRTREEDGGSLGPLTVHIMVVFPCETREEPDADGWTEVW